MFLCFPRYVADQGNVRIRAVSSSLAAGGSSSKVANEGVFEVPDPEVNEAYVFNKFGQHMLTRDIMTGSTLYTLTYTQATSNGKLRTVTDSLGRKLSVMRDYRGQVRLAPEQSL